MRRRKQKQQAAAAISPLALSHEDAARSATDSHYSSGGSGGSPASGTAPPSEPLTEEEVFERTSESGWYVVDEDAEMRPVAYRRSPRFDDRTERTAAPGMLLRAVSELPEWVQCSNRLWLVRATPAAQPAPPPYAQRPSSQLTLRLCLFSRAALCPRPSHLECEPLLQAWLHPYPASTASPVPPRPRR